jgi:CP family cyanate transporter-like MFS transporter
MNIASFAPLLRQISADMRISISSSVSFMSTIYLASAFAFIFVAGQLVDKIGVKRTMILGTAISGAAAVFMLFVSSSYAIVLTLRLIQGAAMAVAFVCLAPALRAYFAPKEYGFTGGLMGGAMSLFASLAMLLTPIVFHSIGKWPVTVALFSILAWVGSILMLFVPGQPGPSKEKSQDAADKQGEMSYFQVFKYPITWLGMGALVFSVCTLRSLESLAPTYLSSPSPMGVGLGDIVAGRFTAALTLAGLLGIVVGGLLLDRVAHGNYRIIMTAGLALSAIFIYLLTFPAVYANHTLLMICAVLAGTGVPFVKACGGPFVINVYPPHLIGRISGLMTGIGSVAAAAGIEIAGKLAERTGRFSSAMVLLALAGAAGCVLSYFLKPELRIRKAATN